MCTQDIINKVCVQKKKNLNICEKIIFLLEKINFFTECLHVCLFVCLFKLFWNRIILCTLTSLFFIIKLKKSKVNLIIFYCELNGVSPNQLCLNTTDHTDRIQMCTFSSSLSFFL